MENLILPCNTPPAPVLPRSLFPKQDQASELWSPKSISLPAKSIDVRLNSLSRNGRLRQAVEELQTLGRTGAKVRSITFINLLDCCITENSLQLGRRLHSLIDTVKGVDTFVETKLVSMYAKCGCLDDAKKVFDEMRQRNIYSWSAMIGAFSRDKRCREVVKLFFLMVEDGFLPDAFLFPKILQSCGNCEDLETGKLMHSLIIRTGLIDSVRVGNSLLAVYAKCGKLGLARRVFDTMVDRDVVTWNSLISGYCQKGQNEEAHKLLDAMKEEGIDPGIVTWNVLISGYSQSGYYDIAMGLMKNMEGLSLTPDVFTWTSVISGFAQNGRQLQALDLFSSMLQSGIEPNGVTIASAVSACSSTQSKNRGEEIHSIAAKLGLADNLLVGNSLIDLYSKCGDLESARKMFDSILEKDLYSWNSMIGGYFQSGYCGKAHELFLTMQEKSRINPNVITWNIMISGYMQNGDKDQAVNLFHQIEREGKVQRNTASWNAIIAGYAQNGEKDNALGVFKQMQSCSIPPNWVTILSILPSCANLVAAEKVKEIHSCVIKRNLAPILSVANSLVDTYAKSGNPKYSKSVFDGIPRKDIISWNSAISGHVLHGQPRAALDLFDQMKQLRIRPNRGTFLAVINACGLAGMVEEGLDVFSSITRDYQIVPAHEHFAAVVEMYGRAGRIGEALRFIRQMPIEPDSVVWASLLTACRIGRNRGLASVALEKLRELDSEKKDKTLTLTLGQSWIETKNKVHTFVSCQSRTGSCPEDLYSLIRDIEGQVGGSEGRESDMWIEDDDDEEESDVIHSEKLAIAFGLIAGPGSGGRSIRIVKNRRMCEDCHRFSKYVSSSYGREICVSDTKRVHCFRDGKCCCGDYW